MIIYGFTPTSRLMKLLCFKIELKFISLKTDTIGFFNTLFIAVSIKLSSPKKALYIVDCGNDIISRSAYLWDLIKLLKIGNL